MAVYTFSSVTDWITQVVDSTKLNAMVENLRYLKQAKLEVGYNNDYSADPNGYCLQTAKKAFTETTYVHYDSIGWYYEDPILLVNLLDDPGVRVKQHYHIGFDIDFTRPTTLLANDFDQKGQTITGDLRLTANVEGFTFTQIDGSGDFVATMLYHNITCEATELNSTTIRVHVGGDVYLNLEDSAHVGVDAQVSFTGYVHLSLAGTY